MLKKFIALICIICLSGNIMMAQTPTTNISGQVFDANHQPAIAATVILINAKDSKPTKTTLADVDGKFTFGLIPAGNYRIKITNVGSKTFEGEMFSFNGSATIQIPAINLHNGGTELKEVNVSSQKAMVEQKIDRTVVNVSAYITNAGATALEALEKAPGLTIDDNGIITFKGKTGVMVLIDDKPTYLSGADLANYLRSLPASVLDQIELMSNPPAKYDASGNAGIINIKTKRSKIKGFNGAMSVNVGKGMYYRTNQSLSLNYRNGKINFFSNAAFGLQTFYRRLDLERFNFNNNGALNYSFKEVAFFDNINYVPTLKTGLDYYVSPKTTIGVVLTGTFNRGNSTNPVNNIIRTGAGLLDSSVVADNSTRSTSWNAGINLNFSHQYDSLGRALTFDLDYLRYDSSRNQDFFNSTYNAAGALSGTQNIINSLPAYVNIYTAKTDYTLPLRNKFKFSTGAKASFVNTDNAANYFNKKGNVVTVDNNLTNHFIYREQINAAYLNLNRDSKRFSFQAGLRAEQTNASGHQLGNAVSPDSSFNQHYLNLFPTAYLQYKLDSAGKHSLKLNYGRRIDRPYYQDLNPFVQILDKYSQFTGNPFLKPQYAADYELSYSYKSMLTVEVSYHNISNYRVEYDYQQGQTFIATVINLGRRPQIGLHTTLNLSPAKWWSFNLYTELAKSTFEGYLGQTYIRNQNKYFYYNLNNQLTLGKGWTAELGMFYITPTYDSQFSHIARQQVNAGLQKKVFNNKGSIRLSMRDIFRGNFSAGNIHNIPNVTATYRNDNANRSVTVGFNYSFGKAAGNPKKRETGSAATEQNRVGN